MALLVPHTFTENSITYILKLPDVYASQNSTIASALGLTRRNPTNFEPGENDAYLPVGQGLQIGKLLKLRLSYRATVNGKIVTKSTRVVCPVSKLDTALAALLGKTYKGNNITGVGIPRRRRLT